MAARTGFEGVASRRFGKVKTKANHSDTTIAEVENTLQQKIGIQWLKLDDHILSIAHYMCYNMN